MLTVTEIEQKEFTRAVRGYREEEVDNFLNLIILEIQSLNKEVDFLRAENRKLKDQLESDIASDSSVYSTLEAARNLMRDISVSAEKRAGILMKNAELDASLIKREAKEEAERLREESADLRESIISFRNRYKNLLETELERFNVMSTDLFRDAERLNLSVLGSSQDAGDTEIQEVRGADDLDDIAVAPNVRDRASRKPDAKAYKKHKKRSDQHDEYAGRDTIIMKNTK